MNNASAIADQFHELLDNDTERGRYRTLINTLEEWRGLFAGRRVLDFGCSIGTSVVALLIDGASEVVGVEPDLARVESGNRLLEQVGLSEHARVIHLEDTSRLPFADGAFEFVIANAVLEHIPQPRGRFIAELWRVVAVGGYLMVNETPNKYFPKEMHTTGLWFNHWLPKRLAFRRAMRRGRYSEGERKWDSSGWRGLGYWELSSKLHHGYTLIPEQARTRQRMLSRLGLPASLLDPYPTWVLQKVKESDH